ncbi:hypothetical protein HDU82_002480 [Entophlyctis luteolus]|nr:hypothetical protein HDU82_002480 [Entophlyctis luteolus]
MATILQAVEQRVQQHFPGAVQNSALLKITEEVLRRHGFEPKQSLFATSLCPDEINRNLSLAARRSWGRAFTMGGLAGFPFVGRTGFKAFSHHVPEGGEMLVICGSHVGVDIDGSVGRIHRHGMSEPSDACGSAVAAYRNAAKDKFSRCSAIALGDSVAYSGFADKFDVQQSHVQRTVAQEALAIAADSRGEMTALPLILARRIAEELEEVVGGHTPFPLAVLNGVQINVERGNTDDAVVEDYFLPLRFYVMHPDGSKEDIFSEAFGPEVTTAKSA